MYNYMLSLQEHFAPQPDFHRHRQEVNQLHRELVSQLSREYCRKLLRLIDLEGMMQEDIALANFVAGFRLACGIAVELRQDAPYSFANEEERQACEHAVREEEYHG